MMAVMEKIKQEERVSTDLLRHRREEIKGNNVKLLKQRVLSRKILQRKIRMGRKIIRETERLPYYLPWKKKPERQMPI